MVVREASSAEDLDAAYSVRRAVFIDEQHVREDEEFDALDAESTHFVVAVAGEIVGTARLRRVVGDDGVARGKVERVAVLARARKSGAGRALMEAVHARATRDGLRELFLAAQLEAIPFYERVGYAAHGEEFVQERIRHRWMKRVVSTPPF